MNESLGLDSQCNALVVLNYVYRLPYITHPIVNAACAAWGLFSFAPSAIILQEAFQ